MIKNYLKIAFRNLWRHRVFSFINIRGLAVGTTACFLIFLYIRFDLNVDSFQSESRISVATGISAPLIALCTISFWAIMAIVVNPVKSKRTQ